MIKRKVIGGLREKLATKRLAKQSHSIIERNYRCPEDEIDIVARHCGYLVFVEVRTKTASDFGLPEEVSRLL